MNISLGARARLGFEANFIDLGSSPNHSTRPNVTRLFWRAAGCPQKTHRTQSRLESQPVATMSRQPTSSQQRPLSQTEELERLEQSITLTLQEIDHNFSRAHRIVTSSILPIVEQYAHHSREVWEGSKFWKQFFEASANVSLSGYEEQPPMEENMDQTVTEESVESSRSGSTLEASESLETPNARHTSTDSIEDIDLSNLSISPSHSTPRPPKQKQSKRGAPSPYKSLGQDVDQSTDLDVTYASADAPRTPSRQTSSLLDDVAMTPEDSSELQRRDPSRFRPGTAQKKSDPLLHTVLDKNYRIQATPLTNTRVRGRLAKTPASAARGGLRALNPALDSSPLAPPELRAEFLNSPVRRELNQTLKLQQQRIPGVSVLTPARKKDTGTRRQMNVWDSDEEDEHLNEATGMPHGMSPPKTMQFEIPQSRLLRTPAREASQHIVDSILASAGLDRKAYSNGDEDLEDFDIDLDLEYDENDMEMDSPSVVRKAPLEDDTF